MLRTNAMQGLTLTASTTAKKHTIIEIVDMQMNRQMDQCTGGNMTSNVTPRKK